MNVASRIHALAPPGGICISERVYDDVRNKPDIHARDLGQQSLKNVDHPIRVYSVVLDGVPIAASAPSTIAVRTWLARRLVVAGAVALVSALAIVIWRFGPLRSLMPGPSRSTPGSQTVTLAVLPFANLSASKDDEYFSDGVTDEIRGDLSKIAGLQVAARSSSFAFKDRNEDAARIAALLHVRNLLEGSVRRSPDKLRIEVELIDATSGFTIWSERYEKDMSDVFGIQSDVAKSVAQSLRVKLLPDVKARIDRRPTENLEAYNLWLQGRYYMQQFTGQSAGKAMQCYTAAIEKDPKFAQAYQGLGDAYGVASSWTIAPRTAIPRARSYYEKALQLDETLAEAHANLASWVLFPYDWDWPGAEREFKRAIALDPNSAAGHADYGLFLAYMGRLEDALPELQRARDLDPLSAETVVEIGSAFMYLREYARADEYFRQAIAMAPDYYDSYWYRGWNLICQAKTADAVPVFEKAAALAPDFTQTQMSLGEIYALAGRRAEALRILDHFKDLSTHQYVDAAAFWTIYFGLGENDSPSNGSKRDTRKEAVIWSHSRGLSTMMFAPIRGSRRFTKRWGYPHRSGMEGAENITSPTREGSA